VRVNFAELSQGWIKEGCQKFGENEGVGDTEDGWGFDGTRLVTWHGTQRTAFGSKWAIGDVIGFAADMSDASNISLSCSVNGSFEAPNGVGFTGAWDHIRSFDQQFEQWCVRRESDVCPSLLECCSR
jgi:hypothetical protein